MTSSGIKTQIALNAAEIVRLHARIHATVALRDTSRAARAEWQQACADFHRRYDALAFPGGYGAALEKFRAADPSVLEPALCFLELRPYFFRSGYMRTVLLRRGPTAAPRCRARAAGSVAGAEGAGVIVTCSIHAMTATECFHRIGRVGRR
jgi:hypothetical protein